MQESFSFLHTEEEIKPNYRYKLIDLCKYIASTDKPMIGFDIETEGLDPYLTNRYILSMAFD